MLLREYFLFVDEAHEGEKNLGAKRNVRNGGRWFVLIK